MSYNYILGDVPASPPLLLKIKMRWDQRNKRFYYNCDESFFVSKYQGDNKYVDQFSGTLVVSKFVLTRAIKVAPLNFRLKIVFSVILFYKNGSIKIDYIPFGDPWIR